MRKETLKKLKLFMVSCIMIVTVLFTGLNIQGFKTFAEDATDEMFNAVNGQYLKVSIGKGLIDYEGLGNLIESYIDFFA